MIPTGLKAAALLGLMVVASADRALLQQSGGNSLHGVALVGQNYFVTNANGTWTLPPLTGTTYGAYNSAFLAASSAPGYSDNIGATSICSYLLTAYTVGLSHVVFPSKSLGVAVGTLAGPTTNTFSTTANILLTTDQGLSWMAVTGLPSVSAVAMRTGTPGGYPAISAGDLTKVYFASKSVGWAVGSSALGGAMLGTLTAYVSATTSVAVTSPLSPVYGYGIIYGTTNGGTVWKDVSPAKPFTAAASAASFAATTPTALAGTFAGDLFGINADATGKNVYVVGAPGVTTADAGLTAQPPTAATGVMTFTVSAGPTILYSGNGGASFAVQTAPASASKVTLLDVAVQKGTTAYAVGGQFMLADLSNAPANPSNWKSTKYVAPGFNGQIIYTTNGGFSWTQAGFPSNGGNKAPMFTCVAINGASVWVGGVVRQDGFYPVPAVWGFTDISTTLTPNPVGNGQTPTNGQSYGLLVSTNGRTFVAAGSVASFPPGFVSSGAIDPGYSKDITNDGTNVFGAAYNFNDVTGITWDNSLHGWIFGNGFIMSSVDGGKTWVFETPASVLGTPLTSGGYAAGRLVTSVANVPTSF